MRAFVNIKDRNPNMPLDWRNEEIGSFFGNDEREILEYKPGSKLFIVDYAGKLLRYSFWFHITDEYVMVSGNYGTPFGADSLYEIVVPCDSVTLQDDPYDQSEKGLAFWYGDPKHKMNLTMMLLKRTDGDLKVWPTTAWPHRHPYQQSMLNSDPNAINRYNVRTDG